jgi:hypothetical protein
MYIYVATILLVRLSVYLCSPGLLVKLSIYLDSSSSTGQCH